MTVKEFLGLNTEQLKSLDKKERVAVLEELGPIANKRIDKLSELPIESPAYRARLDDDKNIRYFTSEGKDNNQLANELKELQTFLGAKTSTNYGARRSAVRVYAKVMGMYQKDVNYEDVVGMFGDDKDKRTTFWEAYNKVLESNPELISTKENILVGQIPSDQAQAKIYEEYKQHEFSMDSDELWDRARKILDKNYKPPKTGKTPYNLGRKK